jgi:hypothetical protein
MKDAPVDISDDGKRYFANAFTSLVYLFSSELKKFQNVSNDILEFVISLSVLFRRFAACLLVNLILLFDLYDKLYYFVANVIMIDVFKIFIK